LWYLSRLDHDFFLPTQPERGEGYIGRGGSYPFGDNVREVPVRAVREMEFDCILFQSRQNYLVDQTELLTEGQRRLPRVYLEHDPPREHPTDTRHPVDDPDVLLVHVTPFNALMWDNGQTPVRVIEHGVFVPEAVRYSGELERGLCVINNLPRRSRRLGLDIFLEARRQVDLDLVGMGSEEVGGLGEVPPMELPAFASRYRFFFNSIRYTSLGLALCEAMMVGLPVIALATTEVATIVENGISGYVDTRPEKLVAYMKQLLADPWEARRLSDGARAAAEQRFNLQRFLQDWEEAFRLVMGWTGTTTGALI
ncbi:MAG TPA: glycosyltransferase family 4 protein, partial [Dehalococcoidia bacterium]|nr:glycosyltransferase family 4 protein [Dehalococcoidia bacterium]